MKDRVRRNTADKVNEKLDIQLKERIDSYRENSHDEISRRIEELDREWDMERVLEVNMSSIALTGVALSALHHRRWLLLPAVVLTFFAQHAIQGWCPPLPIFRRLGYRTRKEIDKEKYALKLLRGDFDEISRTEKNNQSSDSVLRAVS